MTWVVARCSKGTGLEWVSSEENDELYTPFLLDAHVYSSYHRAAIAANHERGEFVVNVETALALAERFYKE